MRSLVVMGVVLLSAGCVSTRTYQEALKKQASDISQGCQDEMDQQEKRLMADFAFRECVLMYVVADNGVKSLWIKDRDGQPVDMEKGLLDLCADLMGKKK